MLLLRLDPASPVPLGEQVRRGIRRAIAERAVAPGDPLPAVRQLASDLGVNLNTVARAYRELEREGLVVAVRGRGTRVASRRSAAPLPVRELRARLRDLVADARLAGYGDARLERLLSAELVRGSR